MIGNKNKGEIVLGTVMEALPNATFRVAFDGNREIFAYLSGRMRLYHIKVMIGNKVKVELNPYDQGKGRIIQRL